MKKGENSPPKIENHIPPPVGSEKNTGITAILRKMKVGDSIKVPPSGSYHSCARVIGIKLVTRSENGFLRVWRVK